MKNKFEIKKDSEKEQVQKRISMIREYIDGWKKMPDSWIKPEDYSDEEVLKEKEANKFRVNYFHLLVGHLWELFNFLENEDKLKFDKRLEEIADKVKKNNKNFKKIPEELIDEIDLFTEEVINKVQKIYGYK